ncbi:MAG TPA: serine/threonine protein kinase, partial [Sorangium sp.]|nr:serine/threonine protein kinase [Sorangium sp.]
ASSAAAAEVEAPRPRVTPSARPVRPKHEPGDTAAPATRPTGSAEPSASPTGSAPSRPASVAIPEDDEREADAGTPEATDVGAPETNEPGAPDAGAADAAAR